MSNGNVRSINQDNVLGGGDELSPSEFDEQQDDVPAKKSSGLLTMVLGIGAAVVIVGFFGWKILSPYFEHRAQDDIAAIAPIENAAQQVNPVASPSAPMEAAQSAANELQPIGTAMAAQPAAAVSPAAPQPALIQPAPAAPQTVQQSPATANQPFHDKAPHHDVTTAPQNANVSAEDIAKINKRIDDISATLTALKDSVEKLKGMKPQPAPSQVTKPVAKPIPAKTGVTALQKKPAQPVAAPSPAATGDKASKPETSESSPAEKSTEEYQLQAVLKGIAWFKTKSGETMTVGPGDELKGVGVVDQIDPDSSRVTFTNGRVFH